MTPICAGQLWRSKTKKNRVYYINEVVKDKHSSFSLVHMVDVQSGNLVYVPDENLSFYYERAGVV
jgi:phage pi2 protein 07